MDYSHNIACDRPEDPVAAQRGVAGPRAEKRHQDHRGPTLHQGPQLQETPGQAEGKVGADTVIAMNIPI